MLIKHLQLLQRLLLWLAGKLTNFFEHRLNYVLTNPAPLLYLLVRPFWSMTLPLV